ncbi:MAG: PqqD family protein [Ignavibacteria bacterium]|nr:PqqD family protein [Ignavibacteria bacterium]
MKLNKNLALSESGFAFNGSTGDSFILNETALFILSKIKSNLSKEEILNSLIEEYDVNPITAEKDLLDFFNQLKIFDLLEDE